MRPQELHHPLASSRPLPAFENQEPQVPHRKNHLVCAQWFHNHVIE